MQVTLAHQKGRSYVVTIVGRVAVDAGGVGADGNAGRVAPRERVSSRVTNGDASRTANRVVLAVVATAKSCGGVECPTGCFSRHPIRRATVTRQEFVTGESAA